jgi:hypothetical protein
MLTKQSYPEYPVNLAMESDRKVDLETVRLLEPTPIPAQQTYVVRAES